MTIKHYITGLKKHWVAFIIGLVLCVAPRMRFSWDIGPQALIHIAVLALLLLIIVLHGLKFSSGIESLILLLFAATCASYPAAFEKANVRNELLVLADCLVLCWAAGFTSETEKRTIVQVPVFVSLFMAAVLFTYFALNPAKYFMGNIVPEESIINLNTVAGYFTLGFPATFTLWHKDRKTSFIPSILIFLGIILTKSRSAMVVAVMVLSFQLWFFYRPRIRYVYFAAGFAAFFIILVTLVKSGSGSPMISDRIIWWKTAVNIFKEHPFFGAGWGNYGSFFLPFKAGPCMNTAYAHNFLFQILAETGLTGLIIWLFTLWFLISRLFNNKPTQFRTAILLSVLAFLMNSLFDFSFFIPAHMLLFWVFLGFFRSDTPALRPKPLIPLWLAAVLFIALSFYVSRPLFASIYYSNGMYYFQKDDFENANIYLLKSAETDPLPFQTYNKLAELNFNVYSKMRNPNYLNVAVEMQKKALKLSPLRPALHSDLAWLYWTAGEQQMAKISIITAIKQDRFNSKYRETLAFFENNSK